MPKNTNEVNEKKVRKIKETDSNKSINKTKVSKTTKTTKASSKTNTKTVSSKSNSSLKNKKNGKKSNNIDKKPRTRKNIKKEEILSNFEYYDLPYRYNQTIVKILAQTPNTLFIYWDISDIDRKNLEEIYGDNFFSITKPVLIIHNQTKNYSFEIDINDFANSWYLHISDVDCKYNIELGRRFLNNYDNSLNDLQNVQKIEANKYVYISSSNDLITPNNHILKFDKTVQFKNVKNNTYYSKEIKDIQFVKSYNLYKELYSEETLVNFPFSNPSSSFKR